MLCLSCLRGRTEGESVKMDVVNEISLDRKHTGADVVVVKQGKRLCGRGGTLGTMPLVQSKAYFECKVQSTGTWGIGLATREVDLDCVPLASDANAWMLRSDGVCVHQNETVHRLDCVFEAGDTIGVTYDHVVIQFYHNGKNLDVPMPAKGKSLYPAMYVDDGSIVDCAFAKFTHEPPNGYTQIMVEHSMM